jgi:YidC/Oxa1 family membrane protein insertase
MWLIYQVVHNYGIALILFTIVLRAVLFPLSIKQQKSSAKMQVFQPKIQEIQKKYANNKEKQQEEMMKLYEQHGYNPMGGCLPSLLQMVFLFGIIYVVYEPLTHILRLDSATISALTEIVKANTDILGSNAGSSTQVQLAIVSAIQNSETVGLFSSIAPDVIEKIQNFDYTLFGLYLGQVPTWKSVLVLIPILSGLTALATSMVSMKLTPGMDQQQNNSMKYMMYFMPIMSLWIAFSVPCGVGIYWIVSNLLAILQTVLLNKFYSPAKYPAVYV